MQYLRLVPPLLLAGLSPWAAAQMADPSSLDPVELRGTRAAEPVRHDVMATCPDAVSSIETALNRPAYLSQRSAKILVHFQLKGSEVESVQAEGAPLDYRIPLRRAVRWMGCSTAGQSAQRYSFMVVVNMEENGDMPGKQRVALQELPILALTR